MKLSDKISNKLKLPGDNQQFTSTKNNGISIKKKIIIWEKPFCNNQAQKINFMSPITVQM